MGSKWPTDDNMTVSSSAVGRCHTRLLLPKTSRPNHRDEVELCCAEGDELALLPSFGAGVLSHSTRGLAHGSTLMLKPYAHFWYCILYLQVLPLLQYDVNYDPDICDKWWTMLGRENSMPHVSDKKRWSTVSVERQDLFSFIWLNCITVHLVHRDTEHSFCKPWQVLQ